MLNKPSTRSLSRLEGVHPVLVAVAICAMANSPVDFFVHEGSRTIEKQKEYINQGVSWTMNSYHLPQYDGYSWAIDIYPTTNRNIPDIPSADYMAVADAMKDAAELMGVTIEWGYDLWGKDMPHFQLREW